MSTSPGWYFGLLQSFMSPNTELAYLGDGQLRDASPL
jgi:hypothetical protein